MNCFVYQMIENFVIIFKTLFSQKVMCPLTVQVSGGHMLVTATRFTERRRKSKEMP